MTGHVLLAMQYRKPATCKSRAILKDQQSAHACTNQWNATVLLPFQLFPSVVSLDLKAWSLGFHN